MSQTEQAVQAFQVAFDALLKSARLQWDDPTASQLLERMGRLYLGAGKHLSRRAT